MHFRLIVGLKVKKPRSLGLDTTLRIREDRVRRPGSPEASMGGRFRRNERGVGVDRAREEANW